jgi:acyl-CoA-binding protein
MSDLKTQFEQAVHTVRTAEGNFEPSNEMKLEFYSLYKQATEGDVKGKRPGMLNIVGRAKYDAWASIKGTSADEAMQRYIDNVNEVQSKLS